MNCELLVCINVEREKFLIENYVGSDDVLALVESGSFTFDDGSGFVNVAPFDAVYFEKNKRYERYIVESLNMFLFRFKSDGKAFSSGKIVFEDKEGIKSLITLLKKIEQGIYQDEFLYKCSAFSYLMTQCRVESNANSYSDIKDELIVRGAEYIQKNIHKNIILTDVSSFLGISYVQFARRFKSAMKITPFEYIAAVRNKKATQLLGNTNLPLRIIAPVCGFNNEYYFSNFFKKYNGVSPSEFRTQLQQL